MESLANRSIGNIAVFFIAGVYTSPDFMEGLRIEVVRRLQEAGFARIDSKLLFPYGDWSRSVMRQLREARYDMFLSVAKWYRSISGQYVLKEIEALRGENRIVLVGHSGGGIAAVHAAQLMKESECRAECRVVQIGSPKCRVPAALRSSITYLFALGKQGRNKDPICRIGSWGGWERSRYRWPVWNNRLHAPSRVIPLPIIGGHADYFRSHAPYKDAEGRSNLAVTVGSFWPWCME